MFTTLSFLLLLKRIETPSAWMWFITAYFLEFMLPSFDFFPWSYGRLIAPMIALWLMWLTANNKEPTQFIANIEQKLAKITG